MLAVPVDISTRPRRSPGHHRYGKVMHHVPRGQLNGPEHYLLRPQANVPKATAATIPDRSFRRRPVTVPGGGGATLRSGKGVRLRAARRAFLRPTETPPPVRLHLQPLPGRPSLPWTSGRSEMRLCFCAGLSPLPGATGFPPLPWEVQGRSPATVEPPVKPRERWRRSSATWEAGPQCEAIG